MISLTSLLLLTFSLSTPVVATDNSTRGNLISNKPIVYYFKDFEAAQGVLLLSPSFQTSVVLEEQIDKIETGDSSLFALEPGDSSFTLRAQKSAGNTDLTITTLSGLRLSFKLVIRANEPLTRRYEIRQSGDKIMPLANDTELAPSSVALVAPAPKTYTLPKTPKITPKPLKPAVVEPSSAPEASETPETLPTPASITKVVKQPRVTLSTSLKPSSSIKAALEVRGQLQETSSNTLPNEVKVDTALLQQGNIWIIQYHFVNTGNQKFLSNRNQIQVLAEGKPVKFILMRSGYGVLNPNSFDQGMIQILGASSGEITLHMGFKTDGQNYVLNRKITVPAS